MNVMELIEKLSSLPMDATVKMWDGFHDHETTSVVVSVTNSGDVFVLNFALGKEV